MRKCALFVVMLLASCDAVTPLSQDDRPATAAPELLAGSVNASAAPANARFHFLPPIGAQPTSGRALDGSLLPYLTVEICDWTTTCATPLTAQFTSTSGPPNDRITLQGNHYAVNFHAPQFALTADRVYRVRVVAARTELGSFDLKVVAHAKDLKDIDGSRYVGIVRNQTLPIKFVIESGAVWVLTGKGGTVDAMDGAVQFVFPEGALPAPVGVTVAPDASAAAAAAVPGTAYEFGPHGTTFLKPVRVTLRFDPARLPSGANPMHLRLYKFVEPAWQRLPNSTADAARHTVSADLSGFSAYSAQLSPMQIAIESASALLAQLLLDPTKTELAQQARLQLVALLTMSGDPVDQLDAQAYLAVAGPAACTEFTQHVNVGRALTIRTAHELLLLLSPIINWAAVATSLNENCAHGALLQATAAEMLGEFSAHYPQSLTAADFFTDFEDLAIEFGRVVYINAIAVSLGFLELSATIRATAQNPLGNFLRQEAFEKCRVNADDRYLRRLLGPARRLEAAYDEDALKRDFQYCGTQINWRVVKTDGTVTAAGFLGSVLPGIVTSATETRGAHSGKLILSGTMRAFRCDTVGFWNNGYERDVISLLAFDDNRVLHRVEVPTPSGGPFQGNLLAAPIEIDLEELTQTAEITLETNAVFRVLITRTSPGCGLPHLSGVGGVFTLAQIDLRYEAATVIDGDVTINSAAELVALRGVTRITGNLTIQASDAITLVDVKTLRDVGGDLIIRRTPLTHLNDLQALTRIGRMLQLNDNRQLADITGLHPLASVGGVHVELNPKLRSLAGLASVAGPLTLDLWIKSNTMLADITALQGITRVRSLQITGANDSLRTVAGLNGIERVDHLNLNGSVGSVSDLSSLEIIGTGMGISDGAWSRLTTFELPALHTIMGGLTIDNTIGTTLTAVRLPALTQVTALSILGSPLTSGSLQSVELPALQLASDGVSIRFTSTLSRVHLGTLVTRNFDVTANRGLTQLSTGRLTLSTFLAIRQNTAGLALSIPDGTTGGNFSVSGNVGFSDDFARALAARFQVGGTVIIFGNGN